MTHVVGDHLTLGLFVKAFDKEKSGNSLGAGIPRPPTGLSYYQTGHCEERGGFLFWIYSWPAVELFCVDI